MIARLCLTVCVLLTPLRVRADDMSAMPGMQHAAPQGGEAASTEAYRHAMASMDAGMAITYTGNADRDFVAGMLPHHQGAVDMARVELRYGTDPKLRHLAQGIVAAQEREIALMRQWQDDHKK